MAAAAPLLATRHMQASIAGQTQQGTPETHGQPAPPQLHETLDLAGIRSELDNILAGGTHPEALATLAAVPSRQLDRIDRPLIDAGPAAEAVAARGRQMWADLKGGLSGR